MSTFVLHGIVTEDLQMRKVCAKLVPKVLTQDQKELRVLRCLELLDLFQNQPDFLNPVVTGDESWMFEYDPETKKQSCAWHTKSSPRPKKWRIKTMIIVFFDIRGIVHCEFVPQGQTVNSAFYLEVLRRLKRRVAHVRTDIEDTVKLHHGNATSHTAFIITTFLARSNTSVIPHPPYSPDLAPCDLFLFPRLKREVKGKHWETVENIQHHVTTFLRSIPVEEFQGPPESPTNCTVQNETESSIAIECEPGYNGGLSQTFLLEVAYGGEVRMNLTARGTPSFLVSGLPAGARIAVTLRAFNAKGSSPPTILHASTLRPAEPLTGMQGMILIRPVLGLLVGIVAALVVLSISIVAWMKVKRKSKRLNGALLSRITISRRLVANGLHSCRPLRRLPLTPPNRRQRLEWCWARSTWMTEWHRVVFSDESRFYLSSDSRRVRVWRRRGERSNPAAIVERPTVRQRGIMVWGAIAYDSRSPLLRIQGTMTAQRYVDDVLRPVTLPYLQGVPNALYQQDNARPHTARISQQALKDVQMLPWPPYSPDLSPIEHVWDIIGRRLHALPQPRSKDELWQMVEREWRAIPQDAIRTLIDSLPRRVAACIAVRGGPTCY
ncbi:hypothetical protein LAZ67_3001497 [Cordylochernes scorpioides]|uniref:Fibronectin type-III domain-containing protein n=1 Tax=Cordylochernes scorpioides TaxID=51811 RepID=A0ABY6KBN5_9ARAC|nr:hypothetical protein LAZ67_3001497 [Cordylochernes scorpioides]